MIATSIADATFVALLLGGCVTAKYQCPTPSGVACMGAKDVYKLTDAPGREGMEAAENAYASKERSKDGRPVIDPLGTHAVRAGAPVALPKPGDVVPTRQQSRVMRIWVAPYEDTRGDPVMATRIYMDMDSKRWAVGETSQHETHHFFLMQVDPAASAPTAVQPEAQTAAPGTKGARLQ